MPSYSGVFTLQAQMQAKAAGNWTPIPLVIGQVYQGGYFAGQISTAGNSIADYNLVVGPLSTAEFTGQWKTSNTTTAGTTSVINGPANTTAMIAAGAALHPCGQFCDNAVIGGFSDWYMPAKNELEVCYYNLKPSTVTNTTSFAINPNAVPARASNYTSGNPAQTSAINFRSTGAQEFTMSWYWSSTEVSVANASVQYINYSPAGDGFQAVGSKNSPTFRVRAVRRVAV
jgi:hypothetical protein